MDAAIRIQDELGPATPEQLKHILETYPLRPDTYYVCYQHSCAPAALREEHEEEFLSRCRTAKVHGNWGATRFVQRDGIITHPDSVLTNDPSTRVIEEDERLRMKVAGYRPYEVNLITSPQTLHVDLGEVRAYTSVLEEQGYQLASVQIAHSAQGGKLGFLHQVEGTSTIEVTAPQVDAAKLQEWVEQVKALR